MRKGLKLKHVLAKIRDKIVTKIWAEAGDVVGYKVRAGVGRNVRDKVRGEVWSKVWRLTNA